jgi:uncharacterized protein
VVAKLNNDTPSPRPTQIPPAPGDLQPFRPGARIPTLDILRGFAVLGMILAHIHKRMGGGLDMSGVTSRIGWFITMAVAEKDRVVFAFLFGVGFAIMMRQLESRGQPVVLVCVRRLAVLYIIGFALGCFSGFHILRVYAWWGVALLFLRNFPTRTLLMLGVLSLAAVSIQSVVNTSYTVATQGQSVTVAAETRQIEHWQAAVRAAQELNGRTNYREVVSVRFRQLVYTVFSLQSFMPGAHLAMFILGLLAVRHGIFETPKRHLRLIMGIMATGGIMWIAGWWLLPLLPDQMGTPRIAQSLHAGLGIIDEQYLAFTFIGCLTLLLCYRPDWTWSLAMLGWVGRLALTNYILQCVLIDFVSAGYGLNLRVQPRLIPVLGLLLFGSLALFSRLWLSRFRYGPIEWLWRSVTFGAWQPLRNTAG